ncbi:hypothetical protein [Myxosarcina sp. GI1(2024)]
MAAPQICRTTVSPEEIDLPPKVIEESPVLQEWLEEVPDVLEDIRHDPSFRTRLRFGLVTFPSTEDAIGIDLAIEDIFIARTGLTVSADYQTAFNGDRTALGADLHYFLFPLGGYVNFAPLVGYRYVQSHDFNSDGVHLGIRLMLALSRTGAGDISISQSFISPGGNQEVGITSFYVGYGVTSQLRIASELELQNSPEDKDTRVGISLEWLL